MSSGRARAKAQMESTKAGAIREARRSVRNALGFNRRVVGSIRTSAWSQKVGTNTYWYAEAECEWEDR